MSNRTEADVVMLVGSGLSVPAGLPRISQITRSVRDGSGAYRHSCAEYLLGAEWASAGITPGRDPYVEAVTGFLDLLARDFHFPTQASEDDPRRVERPTYEELYGVVEQLYNYGFGEHSDPIVRSYKDSVCRRVSPIREYLAAHRGSSVSCGELVRETRRYIQDCVSGLLEVERDDPTYLSSSLLAISRDVEIRRLHIFSLNHDTVIEQFLTSQAVQFVDGFVADSSSGYRSFDASEYDTSPAKVALYKLHGSVDWRRYVPSRGTREDEKVVSTSVYVSGTEAHSFDEQDKLLDRLILVGTSNKVADYYRSVYSQLHCRLIDILDAAPRLLVVGYGFGDRGINTRIIHWMDSAMAPKMTVVEPNPSEMLCKTAREAIRQRWADWQRQKRLVVCKYGIEHFDWKTVKPYVTS